MLAAYSRVVNRVHCLSRGDVAFYAQGTPYNTEQWQQAGKVEMCLKGHKGGQEHIGNVLVRILDEVHGWSSSHRTDGESVSLMLELLSCFQIFLMASPSPCTGLVP